MKRTIVASISVFALLVAGCSSSSPTESEEYQALEQELVAAEQQLAEANQELVQAEAQVAAVTAELDAAQVTATAAQDVTLPAEAVAVLVGVNAALVAHDTEEMRTYLTDDYTFQSYGDVSEVDAYMKWIDTYYESMGFQLEATGPIVVTGGDDTYIVAEPGLSTWTGNPGVHGFSIITLTHEDGTWLVGQTRWVGEDVP